MSGCIMHTMSGWIVHTMRGIVPALLKSEFYHMFNLTTNLTALDASDVRQIERAHKVHIPATMRGG